MSTQGLSNAQIQQTLIAQGLSTEMQYQAMAKAGLLDRKKELIAADLKATLVSQLQSEERANGIYKSTRNARKEIECFSTANTTYDTAALHTTLMNSIDSGQKQISLDKDFSENFDSQTMLNSITGQLNEELGTNLSASYSVWSDSYFLDLSSLTDDQYADAFKQPINLTQPTF